jgi:hypothetical protein
MKITLASAAALLLVASSKATAEFLNPSIFAESIITNVVYNKTLPCGACARGGYTYCLDPAQDSGDKDLADICCDSAECALEAITSNPKLKCATTISNYTKADYFYSDSYVLAQDFCSKRQDSKTCCGNKGANDCKINLKYKEAGNLTVNLDDLKYGGSCTYKVMAKCGYPNFSFNTTNIDVIVSYKQNQWDNDTYVPTQNTTYFANETFNPAAKDGMISWQLPNAMKADQNVSNETSCQMTHMLLTFTNLNNPPVENNQPRFVLAEEARSLQTAANVTANVTMLTYSAQDSQVEPKPDSAFLTSFASLASALLLLAALAF